MPACGTPITADTEAAERDWTERRLLGLDTQAGVLYRVEAVSYAAIRPYADPVSGAGEWYSTAPRLELFGHIVERWTPCGATLAHGWSGARKRWVNLDPNAKQWASRTCREAVRQFLRRREGQLHILAKQTRRAERERLLARMVLGLETRMTGDLA